MESIHLHLNFVQNTYSYKVFYYLNPKSMEIIITKSPKQPIQWSMYSFFLTLVLQSDALLLKLVSCGILASVGGLFSLAILQPFSTTLISGFLVAVIGGMVMMGGMLWRDIRYQQIGSPRQLFLFTELAYIFGGLAVLTKPQTLTHFFSCIMVGVGAFFLLKTLRKWM
jgi:hypothetical protein